MELKRKVIISEELSPLSIALTLLIKIYLSNELLNHRSIVYLLVQHLEGEQYHQKNPLKVAPTLSDLCDAFRTFHKSGIISKSSLPLTPELNPVELAIEKLLDLVWAIHNEEQLQLQISETYTLLLDPNIISSSKSSYVSPRSVVGRFLQRIVVAAKLLHFDESILVFRSFCHFRQSTQAFYKEFKNSGFECRANQTLVSITGATGRKNKSYTKFQEGITIGEDEFCKVLQDQLDIGLGTALSPGDDLVVTPLTKIELDCLVDAQVKFLERFGSPTPPELRSLMEQMVSPYLEFSSAHKTSSGLSPSYHYLRYLESLFEGNYLAAFDSLHQYFDYMVSQGSRYYYHFALIAKASLHQCFGEDQKALDSLEEAISVARENKDNATLTYVLSWLFNFMKGKPKLWVNQSFFQNDCELQLLEFLSRKSQNVSLLLAAVSFCYVTEGHLANGDSAEKLYESLFGAIFVSINDGTTSFVKCCDLASVVWSKLGLPYLSELYVDMGLAYALKFGPQNDVLDLTLKKKKSAFSKGNPENAINELREMLQSYVKNIPQFQRLQKQLQLFQIDTNISSGKTLLANEALKVFLSAGEMDEETRFNIIKLQSSILADNCDPTSAMEYICREISDASRRKRPNIFMSIQLNLIKTYQLIQFGANERALSLLIQQIKLAKLIGFGTILMNGLVQMISLLNNTGSVQEAHRIALRLVPAVTRTQNQHLIAALFYELAKSCCYFLEITHYSRLSSRKEVFTNFLKFLSISIAGYKKSIDLRMLVECFRLEQRVAVAGSDFKDQITNSIPFQNFKKHSQAGLELLQKRTIAESDCGYLKS